MLMKAGFNAHECRRSCKTRTLGSSHLPRAHGPLGGTPTRILCFSPSARPNHAFRFHISFLRVFFGKTASYRWQAMARFESCEETRQRLLVQQELSGTTEGRQDAGWI